MAAFDRICSGIPEMDKALDNIRLGDNVVWRVSELSEFKLFMEPYLRQAIADGRNIIYFRFASHEPLVEDCPDVKTIEVPLGYVGYRPDDGQLFQSHLPVPLYT